MWEVILKLYLLGKVPGSGRRQGEGGRRVSFGAAEGR